MLRTLLINSIRKQYVYLAADFQTEIGNYLFQLEKKGWDLCHDDIYVMYTDCTYGYEDVRYAIQSKFSHLGEIIPEVL